MDDWTEEDLVGFRERLEELESELKTTLSQTTGSAETVQLDSAIGRLSRMDAIQQQHMAQASKRRIQIRMQQIRAAFVRMDEGDYGYCTACDEPIARKRLEARPEGPLCLGCQSRIESSR